MDKQRIWRNGLLTAAAAAGGWLGLRFLGPVLLPFAVGLLAALAAEPVVAALQRRLGLPRWASAGLSVAGLYLLLLLALGLLCRLLWQELTGFFRSLPALVESLAALWAGMEDRFLALAARLPDGVGKLLTDTASDVFQNGAGLAERLYEWVFAFASGLLKRIPDILLFLLTAVLSSFMLAAELPRLRDLWRRRAPARWQQRGKAILRRLRETLGSWLKAQAKLMLISALVLTAGFLILHVDYPLLFGLAIALIDALPVLGTGVILIPWGLFMFLQGNTFLGVGLLCLYGASALIRTALEPRMLGKQMGLDPLLTLLALYAGYRFLGVLGMILFPIGAIFLKQLLSHLEKNAGN